MSEWISVKDRLPIDKLFIGFSEESDYYDSRIGICSQLRKSPSGIKVTMLSLNDDNVSYLPLNTFKITHWMPLPEPPKEN